MSITRFVLAALAGAALSIVPTTASAQAAGHAMPMNHAVVAMHHPATHAVTVYKSPDCDCCGRWIEHLRGAGFTVKVVEVPDVTPTKASTACRRRCAPAIRRWWAAM